MFGLLVRVIKNPIVYISTGVLASYGVYVNVVVNQAGKTYAIGDQKGKTYIVTGATDGIGKALTEALAAKRARVIMACRDRDKCLEVRREIVYATKNKEVYCRVCNMSDFESIRQFAAKLVKGKHEIDRIDGIVHNAATMEPKRKVNESGVELCLATNHMGPFLLTGLLLQKLLDQPHPSRIVFVNTGIAAKDRVELDLNLINQALYTRKAKLDVQNGKYRGLDAYRFSKAMELCFTRELSERLKDSNIMVLSADPGWTRTKLESREMNSVWHWLTGRFLRRPDKAVKPILFALADESAKNGLFVDRDMHEQAWGPNCENSELRERIWLMSENWTKFRELMAKTTAELELDSNYFGELETQIKARTGRSWKWLWLK